MEPRPVYAFNFSLLTFWGDFVSGMSSASKPIIFKSIVKIIMTPKISKLKPIELIMCAESVTCSPLG